MKLERDMYPELQQPLVNPFTAESAVGRRDRTVIPKILDGAVVVQDHIRDIPVGIRKMRRIGRIEGVRADLHMPSLANLKLT